MKFAIFKLGASVDNRPLPGAWVAELLGVVHILIFLITLILTIIEAPQ